MAPAVVVDDAGRMWTMVRDPLAMGGHEVVGEAGNAEEAVDGFRELSQPDRVIGAMEKAPA